MLAVKRVCVVKEVAVTISQLLSLDAWFPLMSIMRWCHNDTLGCFTQQQNNIIVYLPVMLKAILLVHFFCQALAIFEMSLFLFSCCRMLSWDPGWKFSARCLHALPTTRLNSACMTCWGCTPPRALWPPGTKQRLADSCGLSASLCSSQYYRLSEWASHWRHFVVA